MLNIAFLILWPLLQIRPQLQELSTHWHPSMSFDAGVTRVVAVLACPAKDSQVGQLLVVDSSGKVAEARFADKKWTIERVFPIGEDVTSACTGAPRDPQDWSLFVGTKSGRVIEATRGAVGWVKHDLLKVSGPIRAVRASDVGRPGPSQLFVIDGKGLVTDLFVGTGGVWGSFTLPATEGGAGDLCFDYPRMGLCVITAGPLGIIHRFVQDSTGHWNGGAWATMSAPCLELATSADPSGRDICIFYSGQDGIFRYLFYDPYYKRVRTDAEARLPIAAGTRCLIGKGDQRRFNEFFAMSGNDFCMFEFDPKVKDWVKETIESVPCPVVATTFGPGRGQAFHQMYAACANGKIYEFVREGLENEPQK